MSTASSVTVPVARQRVPSAVAVDLVCLAVVTTWGLNFVVMKRALERFEIPMFNLVRFSVMVTFGWAIVVGQRGSARRRGLTVPALLPSPADRPRIAAAGLVGFFGYLYGFSIGVHHTSAFSAGILTAMSSLFVAILLWTTGSERLARGHVLALVAAAAGAVVFVAGRSAGGIELRGGDVMALLAAFLYASYLVINRPLLGRYPPMSLTTWSMTVGFAVVVVVTIPFVRDQDWSRVDPIAWLAMLWCTTAPVFVAWTVWAWANTRAGVARPSLFLVLVPIVSGSTAWWLLDEQVRPLQLVGLVLVVAALLLGRRASTAGATRLSRRAR